MSPATIEVPLGRFIAHVPRDIIIAPSQEVEYRYNNLKSAVESWRGSLEGIQACCERDLPGIIVTTPMQTIGQYNMQKAVDKAEAEGHNNDRGI